MPEVSKHYYVDCFGAFIFIDQNGKIYDVVGITETCAFMVLPK